MRFDKYETFEASVSFKAGGPGNSGTSDSGDKFLGVGPVG